MDFLSISQLPLLRLMVFFVFCTVSEDENTAMLSHKRLDDLKHLLTKVQEICSSYEFDSLDAGLFYPIVDSFDSSCLWGLIIYSFAGCSRAQFKCSLLEPFDHVACRLTHNGADDVLAALLVETIFLEPFLAMTR